MRRIVFAVVMCVLFVGTSLADINQNTGTGLSAYAATIGPAQSWTHVVFASSDDAATNGQIAYQNASVLGSVGAISGEDGVAVARIDGLTVLGQSVGDYIISQAMIVGVDLETLAVGNGTATATVGESAFSAAANEGSFSTQGVILAAVSISSAGPVSPSSPGGSAMGGVSVTLLDTATVLGNLGW